MFSQEQWEPDGHCVYCGATRYVMGTRVRWEECSCECLHRTEEALLGHPDWTTPDVAKTPVFNEYGAFKPPRSWAKVSNLVSDKTFADILPALKKRFLEISMTKRTCSKCGKPVGVFTNAEWYDLQEQCDDCWGDWGRMEEQREDCFEDYDNRKER